MVIIEVVLVSLAINIVILIAVFISSIIVKDAAVFMAAFVVCGAAAADDSSSVSITEGHRGRPSVHRSRTLAPVSMAVAIIKAGHRAIIAEVPAAFDGAAIESTGAAIEATATIIGLEEVAASTFSAIINDEALAVISSEVAAITFTIIAWVVAVGFAELRVGQERASAGHSQALALTPRKDHPDHLLHRRTHRHTHHHSHLLRRSNPKGHRTTFDLVHNYHQHLKGLVRRSSPA